MNDDLEIEEIFSKHLKTNSQNKKIVEFNNETIKQNKELLHKFKKKNLTKQQPHLVLDEQEILGEEVYKESDKNKEKEKKGYFKELINDTIKNEYLYSGYLDQFDKIWMNNNVNNHISKRILSCAACFNQIAYESEPVKSLPDLFITNSTVNCFEDYFETLSSQELIDFLKNNIKDIKINENKLNLLDINIENKELKEYVSVKCYNCYNLVGILDTYKNRYIMFNCFS
jgi:hypothetical protein